MIRGGHIVPAFFLFGEAELLQTGLRPRDETKANARKEPPMKTPFTLLLAAVLMFSFLIPAQATIGRDILLVTRSVGSWVYTDVAIVLCRDGSRWQFDLREVPQEIKGDLKELLFFLQLHGLGGKRVVDAAPDPVALDPVTEEVAQQVADQLPQLQEEIFEPPFYAFDAGSFLLYAIYHEDGEARLTMLSEGGTYIGSSQDPAAQAIIRLAGPLMLGE